MEIRSNPCSVGPCCLPKRCVTAWKSIPPHPTPHRTNLTPSTNPPQTPHTMPLCHAMVAKNHSHFDQGKLYTNSKHGPVAPQSTLPLTPSAFVPAVRPAVEASADNCTFNHLDVVPRSSSPASSTPSAALIRSLLARSGIPPHPGPRPGKVCSSCGASAGQHCTCSPSPPRSRRTTILVHNDHGFLQQGRDATRLEKQGVVCTGCGELVDCCQCRPAGSVAHLLPRASGHHLSPARSADSDTDPDSNYSQSSSPQSSSASSEYRVSHRRSRASPVRLTVAGTDSRIHVLQLQVPCRMNSESRRTLVVNNKPS